MAYFTLPDLGEGLQEAEIVQWHIKVGERIKADALLLSVETAKAIVDIPAPKSGEVEKLFVSVGDIVHTGEALLAFVGDASSSQTVVGQLAQEQMTDSEDFFVAGAITSVTAAAGIAATPAVRALAHHLGVALDAIHGSGVGGAITLADVEQAAHQTAALDDAAPLRGVARSMAKAMTTAGAQVVPVSLFDQVCIQHWPAHTDLMLRLLHAIVVGHAAEPALNAWFDGDRLSAKRIEQIDLGIAVDTPDGLFVPVLRDIAKRTDADLRQGIERLRTDVKNRRIPVSELRGASFTLSNFGTLGGRFSTPIVVPPQVAILGVGRSFMQPALHDGTLIEARQLPLSLTFDHRALNGAQAARFLAAVSASLSA